MYGETPPRMLLIGVDRCGLQACGSLELDAVLVCGASAADDGLVSIPEGLTVLRVDEQSSPEAVLMALHRAGLAGARFDAVQTTDEWSLVSAGLLAQHLGARGLDPRVAVHFRDKSLQKQAVRRAGLPTATTVVIEDIHDVSWLSELPFERAVLKPLAGAATARTSVVTSVAELQSRSREYREQAVSQRSFVLEEFQDGEEWFADGVVHRGEVLFCAVGRYGDPCLTTLDRGLPLWLRHFDPDSEDWAYQRAVPLVESALGALGLTDGLFHLELFHDADTGTVTFSECAARRGGGLIHEQIQAKFGVNLAECGMLVALDRRPEIQLKVRPEIIGSTFLAGRPGTLLDCPSAADVMALPGVEFARIERPVGTRFGSGLASTNQRVGQFLLAADSVEHLMARFAEVRSWFEERLRVLPDGLKTRELRELQRELRPDADFGDTMWS